MAIAFRIVSGRTLALAFAWLVSGRPGVGAIETLATCHRTPAPEKWPLVPCFLVIVDWVLLDAILAELLGRFRGGGGGRGEGGGGCISARGRTASGALGCAAVTCQALCVAAYPTAAGDCIAAAPASRAVVGGDLNESWKGGPIDVSCTPMHQQQW
jgi:hypothetical protein